MKFRNWSSWTTGVKLFQY